MGAFDTINPAGTGGISQTGGSLGAFTGKGNKNNVAALFGNPVFLQALFALASAGKNPFEELGQFFTKGKPPKGSLPGQTIKLGKSYLDVGALSAKLPDYFNLQEDAAIKSQGATYEKLKNTPQFANIYNEAQGNFSQEFDAQTAQAFGQLGNYALGAGVKSGFLNDPNKQASLLAPVAVQLAQYKQNVKKQAEQQALAYSGAGVLPANQPAGLLGGQSAGSYVPGLFAAGGLFQGNNQFNSQLGFAQQAQAYQNQNTSLGNAQNILGGIFSGGGFFG